MLFHDRAEAGRMLARLLGDFAQRDDVLVLGLPRGGIPVAYEVASALGAPLDVFVVRKLGVPWEPELAFGAVATGSVRVLNEDVVEAAGISEACIEAIAARERLEVERREHEYRGFLPPPDLRGRCVVLVDDGLATGSSMRAAVAAARRQRPAWLVVAVPAAAEDVAAGLRMVADEVVCAETPPGFFSVGGCYGSFPQVDDARVRELLSRSRAVRS